MHEAVHSDTAKSLANPTDLAEIPGIQSPSPAPHPAAGHAGTDRPSLVAVQDPSETGRRTALAFLSALYGAESDVRIVLWTTRRRRTAWPDNVATAARTAVLLARTDEVYFGVAPRRHVLGTRHGTARDVLALPALWSDLGLRAAAGRNHDLPPARAGAWAILDDFPLPPSAIVHTADAYQAYWCLAPWFPNDDLNATRALVAALGQALSAIAGRHGWRIDERIYEPARGMRLPGTYHRVRGRPHPVRIERLDPGLRYRPEELQLAILSVPARLRLSV